MKYQKREENKIKKRLDFLEENYKKTISNVTDFQEKVKENVIEKIKEKTVKTNIDKEEYSDKLKKIIPKIENFKSKKVKKILKSQEKVKDKEIEDTAKKIEKIKKELSKIIIGQEKVVDGLIGAIICNGHVLLEGVPGIAKTLLVKALGKISGAKVNRVQFTIDILPTDIIGINMYTPKKGFEIIKGAIFTNFLIADEINRSSPKTQSALIEAMQEKQVTIGRETFKLPEPFFVMATQNPLESTGVFQLPEAQKDRFIFKLIMEYPEEKDEMRIMETNTNLKKFEDFNLKNVISLKDIIKMQETVKKIYMSEHIKEYIISIIKKTRDKKTEYSKYISYGASPRATISLFIASKAKALINGRDFVLPKDVKDAAYDVLRHRIILSYNATIENLSSDDLIDKVLDDTPII